MPLVEKAIATKLDESTLEALTQLATSSGCTISTIVRRAVEKYLEDGTLLFYPLAPKTAHELANYLDIDTKRLAAGVQELATPGGYSGLAGVYLLVNQETNQLYVGSSVDLSNRMDNHRFTMKNRKHRNPAMKHWSLDDVVVVVLESQPTKKGSEQRQQLLHREQYYIDSLSSFPCWELVNLATATTNSAGVKNSKTLEKENTSLPATKSKKTAPPTSPLNGIKPYYQTILAQANESYESYECLVDSYITPLLRKSPALGYTLERMLKIAKDELYCAENNDGGWEYLIAVDFIKMAKGDEEEDTILDTITEELFYENWVKPELFGLLEGHGKQTKDLAKLMNEAREASAQHYEWAVKYLKEYNDPWVNKFAADDKFPRVPPEWGQ